ncbi:SRPBCC family protein [Klenkia taihuensis]|uniref:Polyketide cyclase / dehydrase and lipid transport n=1 Tax=Klenkia taihuensis TaxID=1225127 RepID=A0A1I1MCR8_9ACTN|nr:SRPBCC family protein [Klenkia taihuensis]GHE14196.1 polyketide cyclase [Klenkia taihuensis]SFC82926.1 Polyketide cyclase / dehydrase and lipid transport [Klenkia taihuensis]
MPELVETVDVDAPREQVFAALVDWTTQGEWMLLTDVRTVDGPAQEVGGRIEAVTGLPLPGGRRLGVLDRMTITGWDPPNVVDVRHTGRVVRGTGSFQVRERPGGGSTFVWVETLDLPLGALGRLGWPLVKPGFVAGVRLSLKRFSRYAESRAR